MVHDPSDPLARATARHLDAIENVTGSRPATCPWRAFNHPLVREVIALAPAFDPPNLAAVMEPDPPAILVDAILWYRSALASTLSDDSRKRREKVERERAARDANRKR